MMKSSLLFFFLSILSISCSTTDYFKSKGELLQLSGRNTFPTKEEFSEVNSVVLYEENLDDYINTGSPTNIYYKAKLILKNNDINSSDYIFLTPEAKVKQITARIINPDNTMKVLQDSELEIYSALEGKNNLSNNNVLKIQYPKLQENTILELYCQSQESKLVRGYNQYFLQNGTEYKLIAKYIVRLPIFRRGHGSEYSFSSADYWRGIIQAPTWSIVLNYCDLDSSSKDSVIVGAKYNDYIFQIRNIKPMKPEPLMPPDYESIPNIKYCIFKKEGWNYYSNTYYFNYILPKISNLSGVKPVALEIIKDNPDEIEKIRKLYNYVSNMRFEDIAFGLNGIEPASPSEVIKRQYGDSKDKSTLLVSLLRSIDIPAFPVLALTKDYRDINIDFPEFAFNKMIVMAKTSDNKEIFLDPTINLCQINQLQTNLEGTKLFVIDYDGNYIFKSVNYSEARDNRIEYSVNIHYDSLLRAKYDVFIRFYGEKDIQYRNNIFNMEYEESLKFIKERLNNSKFDFEIKDVVISNFYEVGSPFMINFIINTDKAAIRNEKTAILDYDIFNLDDYKLFQISKDRRYPIDMDYAYSVVKNIHITFDSTKFKVAEYPESSSNGDKYIKFTRELNVDNGKIVNYEEFCVDSPRIPVEAVNSLIDKTDKIQESLAKKIILTGIK